MSQKDYFSKATTIQALSNKSAEEIASEVESVGYQTQDIIKEERFIPQVDFSLPETFARYGSAAEYYDQALKHIYDEYPYDGSLRERLKWENESTYLDLYIFDNEYPRTNGYIAFSPDGWGSLDGAITDGYGPPATQEYIYLTGGPHVNPNGMTPYAKHFTGSNYYEPDRNRESNLQLSPSGSGVSIEFWLKKQAFDTNKTEKEVIFDLWNGEAYTSPLYARFTVALNGATALGANPFLVTLQSGSTDFVSGAFEQPVAASTFTTASVADNNWHHYAITLLSASAGITSNFYVDGTLNNSTTLTTLHSTGLNDLTGAMRANIGALITAPSASSATAGAGKLSGSLDEFRYWKTQRSGKDIGRFWFTQVGGGSNDDPTPFIETTENVNTLLGVYYKFNEGITGDTATDSTVLDFSGRVTNGTWTGYGTNSRSTGSAIVESNAAIKEYKDPIIYSFHPLVEALSSRLQTSGSSYDVTNNSAIYNSIPAWITEEDQEGQKHVKYLTQIMGSYFDTLHLQIESVANLKDITYPSGSHKAIPFADRLLASMGSVAPDLFVDADVLEKLADRSEDRVYEKSLSEIKNTIYKNIYNNLVYIYKSKGTEKSFRNLIRAFGIDDDLVKLNVYGNGIQYEMRNNRRLVSAVDRYVDFNTADNSSAVVYQYQNPDDTTNTTGYIPSMPHMTGGFATTLETQILFPLKQSVDSEFYVDTNSLTSSLFGVHGVPTSSPESTLTWPSPDYVNYQVVACRDEKQSNNVHFQLQGTTDTVMPTLTSSVFQDVYNNTHWNLSVRIKPNKYPLEYQVAGGTQGVYTVELHGVQIDAGVVRNEFTVAGTIASSSATAAMVTGSKRVFVGAHRTNFTGPLLQSSDVKVSACRYWADYLDDPTLLAHAYDTENYGTLRPSWYAFPFVASGSAGSNVEVLQADTLLFNWEFSQNSSSNASGQFTVVDEYSGSAAIAADRFSWMGPLLSQQYSGLGDGFLASSTTAIDKDHVMVSKLQLPENVHSSDMVTVLNAQDQNVFTRDSRPVNYFFAFEKSMAAAVSAEIINYFATLHDINNVVGAAVNRYRPEYKGLRILRQRFFERVKNSEIDFEKFYEFYKWFDSSLTEMLQQLVPASADFAESVRTIIESHMLERSKYQSKFQNVKQQDPIIQGTAVGPTNQLDNDASPEDDPQGTGFYSANASTRRQIGTSQPTDFKIWKQMHAPVVAKPGLKSLLFDGTDDYVNAPQIAGAGNNAAVWEALVGAYLPYSISLWVYPVAMGDSNPILVSLGDRDRALKFDGASFPADVSFNQFGPTFGTNTRVSSEPVSTGAWTHIVATFEGGLSGESHIYINGVLKDGASTVTTGPSTISSVSTLGLSIGGAATQFNANAYMCDVAIWNKELNAFNVEQVYAGGTRTELTSLGAISNHLLSWWKMGSDPRDTYNGTIYDQKGGRNGTPNSFPSNAISSLSPAFSDPYGLASNQNDLWWKSMAERYNTTLSQSYAPTNTNKEIMLNSIRATNRRALRSPYKFGAAGNFTLGGIGFNQNKRVNFIYEATLPFGACDADNDAPVNIIAGSGSQVEQLINTTDDFHPAYKQRLGFGVNPSINRTGPGNSADARNGNLLLPFSLYSSSVTTGFNNEVVTNYATGTMITNMHHDLVYDSDIPMQGPFTERFVGGRQYRHTPINESGSLGPSALRNAGLDTAYTRGEGWKLEFSGVKSAGGGNISVPSLSVVPPNYDGAVTVGYNADLRIAHRLRNVGTKRPVNIQNIRMTTASLGVNISGALAHGRIGNYQHNYQVVQSTGRSKNDLFFRKQTFDFANTPETLATRGRFPLIPGNAVGPAPYYTTSSLQWATQLSRPGSGSLYQYQAHPDACDHLGALRTWMGWLKLPTNINNKKEAATWFYIGDSGYRMAAFYPAVDGDSHQLEMFFAAQYTGAHGAWISSGMNIPTGVWVHVAITWNRDLDPPEMYLNGTGSTVTTLNTPIGLPVTPSRFVSAGPGYPLTCLGWNLYQTADPGYGFPESVGMQGFGGPLANASAGMASAMADFAAFEDKLTAAQIKYFYQPSGSAQRFGPWNYDQADWSGSYSSMTQWYPFCVDIGDPVIMATGSDSNGTLTSTDDRIHNRSAEAYNAGYLPAAYLVSPDTIPLSNLAASDTPEAQLSASGGGKNQGALDWDSEPGGTANSGGVLNYAIPARTGSDSNQTVIVNRFAGCGYEVMSLGYMDPAHEEMSVYNALPYRNLAVRNYGLSGSASVDPSLTGTLRVKDQLDKVRGLDQRYTLHCGPFGSDAAYGSVPELTYVTTPSYHKVNRNARKIRKEIVTKVGYFNGSQVLSTQATSWGGSQPSENLVFWDSQIGLSGSHAKAYSVSAWIKPNNVAAAGIQWVWLAGAPTANARGLRLDSTYGLYAQAGTTTWKRLTAPLVDDEWYHVVVTYPGGAGGGPIVGGHTPTIYLNGVSQSAGRCSNSSTGGGVGGFILGGDAQPGFALGGAQLNTVSYANNAFTGSIAEVAVWGDFLDAATVTRLYNSRHLADVPNATTGNLIAWWRLNPQLGGGQVDQRLAPNVPSGPNNTNLLHAPNGLPTYLQDYDVYNSGSYSDLYSPIHLWTHQSTVYNNWNEQYAIPQSTQQYSWVTSSIRNGYSIYGLQKPMAITSSTLSALSTGSFGTYFKKIGYTQLSNNLVDKVNLNTHTLGELRPNNTVASGNLSASHFGTLTVRPGAWYNEDQQVKKFWRGNYFDIGDVEVWNQALGQASTGYRGSKKFSVATWAYWAGAVDLYPDGDYANVNHLPEYPLLTLGTWHRALGLDRRGNIIGIISGSTASFIAQTQDLVSGSKGVISPGQWYHIVWTYNGYADGASNPCKLYINGQPWEGGWNAVSNFPFNAAAGQPRAQKYVSAPVNISSEANYFGAQGACIIGADVPGNKALYNQNLTGSSFGTPGKLGRYFFNGEIAEMAMYNFVVTEDQAAHLYRTGMDTAEMKQGQVAWYRFDPYYGDNSANLGTTQVNNHFTGSWNLATGSTGVPLTGSSIGTLMSYDTGYRGALLTWKSGSANYTPLTRLGTGRVPYRNEGDVIYSAGGRLRTLMNKRSGPYGYPTWKQIRTGEHPVARALRKNNRIGTELPPGTLMGDNGEIVGLSSNEFVDYTEQAVASNAVPATFAFEDNDAHPDDTNNITLRLSHQNNLDYFSNQGLNNQLGLDRRVNLQEGSALDTVVDFTLSGTLSVVARYGEKIYPSNRTVYQTATRTRPNYDIKNIWADIAAFRCIAVSVNSQGETIGIAPAQKGSIGFAGIHTATSGAASVWPLDMHGKNYEYNLTASTSGRYTGDPSYNAADVSTTGPLLSGSGELQNLYTRFSSSLWRDGNWRTDGLNGPVSGANTPGTLAAGCSYIMPTLAGYSPPSADKYAYNQAGQYSARSKATASYNVLFGFHSWSAGEQSGLAPYQNYDKYAEMIRLVGKDMTVVPEFRISEHLSEYITTYGGNFMKPLAGIFDLTGAVVGSSATGSFYRTYSTTDFMKYFKVVDDALADKANGTGQVIRRDSLELRCDALMQFLPYKGFYPAERTVELAALLSQSLGRIEVNRQEGGDFTNTKPSRIGGAGAEKSPRLARRPLMEPLVSPGILFNTIKSGVPCSSILLMSDTPGAYWQKERAISFVEPVSIEDGTTIPADWMYPMSNLDNTFSELLFLLSINNSPGVYGRLGFQAPAIRYLSKDRAAELSASVPTPDSNGFTGTSMYGTPLPFEAIRDPEAYLTVNSLGTGSYLYDTGQYSSSLNNDGAPMYLQYVGPARSPLYKLGIDNFLCETVNFFQNPLKSYVSRAEEDFLSVKKDQYYGLQVMLRDTSPRSNITAVNMRNSDGAFVSGSFGMYSNDASFGPGAIFSASYSLFTPSFVAGEAPGGSLNKMFRTYEPWVPPSWYGWALANIIFKAPYSGKVSVDDILGNSVVEYDKRSTNSLYSMGPFPARPPGSTGDYMPYSEFTGSIGSVNQISGYESGTEVGVPQISSSVNLLEKLLVIPEGTNAQQARWMIQPKWEVPVLNFHGVPATASELGYHNVFEGAGVVPASSWATKPKVRGMWHQYGSEVTGEDGIFLELKDLPGRYSSPTYGDIKINSLNKVVGFETDQKRMGTLAGVKKVSEAIVCVPFVSVNNQRRFFDIDQDSPEYDDQSQLLEKYVFPPTFDFLINDTVNPVAFYAFEFSLDFTRQDLINIWQNLPPESNGTSNQFKKASAEIKIRSLVDKLLDNDQELQWLVFKVKQRAEKDYNIYSKKGLATGEIIVEPAIDSPYSYNWPYDYFSMVELVKIEERIVYATDDVTGEE